jgi:hypothetical protein
MNYILLSLNRADLTISELHLFEHYLSEKVLEMDLSQYLGHDL